jgi:uncharacterized protein (TIRG00374 family)
MTLHYIPVKNAKYVFLVLGLLLLAKLLSEADWQQIGLDLAKVGWGGFAIIMGMHVFTFLTDVVGWQLTFTSIPPAPRWTRRLYAIRLAGEAFNHILPAASMGGEPFKVALLKTHYQVPYREAAATLVVARTANTIALLGFVALGFVFLVTSVKFPQSMVLVAGIGLAVLAIITVQFFLVQWFKFNSRVGRRLLRTRFGRRIERAVNFLQDMDDHIVQFYRASHLRFAVALLLGTVNWMLGAVEVFLVMRFIGHPVSFTDAWIVESLAQLMRAGVFFIPAAVGVQEGTFMVACRALTGVSETGVAMAVVRRCRELIWISLGLGFYWLYSLRRQPEPASPEALS